MRSIPIQVQTRHPYAAVRQDPSFTFVLPRTGVPAPWAQWDIGWEGHSPRPREIHGRLHASPHAARMERRWTQAWDGLVTIVNGPVAVGLQKASPADLREMSSWLEELIGEMHAEDTHVADWWLTWGTWTVEFVGWHREMVQELRDSIESLLACEALELNNGGRTEDVWRLRF